MIYVAIQNTNFIIQIKYIFDYFLLFFDSEYEVVLYKELEYLEIPDKSIVISYGKSKPEKKYPNHIHIYEFDLFGEKYLKPDSLPEASLKKFEDIYIIYRGCKKIHNHLNNKTFDDNQNLIETDIDIVASSFFMLTRYEEYLIGKRDKFNRFSAKESLAYKMGFLDRPIVNDYINLLWKWIDSFRIGLNKKIFWNGKDFAFCLTHDIDNIKGFSLKPPLKRMTKYLCNREYKRAKLVLGEYLKSLIGYDPTDIFNFLNVDNHYGLKNTCFLKGGGFSKYDSNYYRKLALLEKLMKFIKDYGNEVALHGSFDSYKDLKVLLAEKHYIEKIMHSNIYGVRQHYLRFSAPFTWFIHEKAGLKYDCTLGYPDCVGFKCGVCFPFKPFDLKKNKVIDIWEIPLIVMDNSLYFYQNMGPEEGERVIMKLIKRVKEYNGIFNLLWHNTSMCKSSNPGWDLVYKNILNHANKQNFYNRPIIETIEEWETELKK